MAAGNCVYAQDRADINNLRFERKTFVKKSDKAEVELSYPVFTCPEKPAAADSLNNIVDKYIGFLIYSEEEKKYIKRDALDIFAELERQNDEWMEELGMKMELISRVEIVLNDYGIVTLELSEYSFSGGAHGSSYLLYTVFDINKVKRIKLNDLFNKGFITKLTKIGEEYFRELRNHEPTTNLEEAGYWFENNQFALPDNFFISKDGLGFTYNQYEIASYADGIITFTIPFYELNELFSKNSVLSKFVTFD